MRHRRPRGPAFLLLLAAAALPGWASQSAEARPAPGADPHMAGLAARGTVGNSMDEDDRRQVAQTLEFAPTNTPTRWDNPETLYRFTLVPLRNYQTAVGPCREYSVDRVAGDGRVAQVLNRACRRQNGDWRLTE